MHCESECRISGLKHDEKLQCGAEVEVLYQCSSNINSSKKYKEKQVCRLKDNVDENSGSVGHVKSEINLNSKDDSRFKDKKSLRSILEHSPGSKLKRKYNDESIQNENVEAEKVHNSKVKERKTLSEVKEFSKLSSPNELKWDRDKVDHIELDSADVNIETKKIKGQDNTRTSKRSKMVKMLKNASKYIQENNTAGISDLKYTLKSEMGLHQGRNCTVNSNEGKNSEPELIEIETEIACKRKQMNKSNKSVSSYFKTRERSLKGDSIWINMHKKKHINELYSSSGPFPEIYTRQNESLSVPPRQTQTCKEEGNNESISKACMSSPHLCDTLPQEQLFNAKISEVASELSENYLHSSTKWDVKPSVTTDLQIEKRNKVTINHDETFHQHLSISKVLIFVHKNTELPKPRSKESLNSSVEHKKIEPPSNEDWSGSESTVVLSSSSDEAVDVEMYTLLQGRPRTDDIIAFKVLKLNLDGTSKLSEYVTAKVKRVYPTSGSVSLQVIYGLKELQQARGSRNYLNNATYMLQWNELLESRLIYP